MSWAMLEWSLMAVCSLGLLLRAMLVLGEVLDYRVARDPEKTKKLPIVRVLVVKIVTLRDLLKSPVGILLMLWGLGIALWRLGVDDPIEPPSPQVLASYAYLMVVPFGLLYEAIIDSWTRWRLRSYP